MRLASCLRLLVLGFILSIGVSLHAKMDLPPILNTQEEFAEYERMIRTLIPETGVKRNFPISVIDLISMEQNLLRHLLADPEYVAAAEARPPLQTLRFQEIKMESVRGMGANPQWDKFLEAHGYDPQLNEEQAQKELLSLFHRWSTFSANGFFSGWAALLRGEIKEILREPDLIERWRRLKAVLTEKDPAVVRNFKAERYGITSPDWTLNDLDAVVERLNELESRILVLLQRLNQDLPFRDRFTTHGIEHNAGNLLSGLSARALRLYADPDMEIVQRTVTKELILREVPPTLAIYRGVVGNDCSTERSFAYPYSPYERVWWVEKSDGTRLGYVSGNITLVEDRPSLFIRDVQVPGLHGDDAAIDLILAGFYLARPYYGVNQMTVMNTNFTFQNNLSSHREKLVQLLGATSEPVQQKFQDERWREGILKSMVRADGYDGSKIHAQVRRVFYSPETLEKYQVQRTSGGAVEAIDPQESPEQFWEILASATMNQDPFILQAAVKTPEEISWKNIINLFWNRDRLPVELFYGSVELALRQVNLPVSRNLMRKFESVFANGHLAAPDAFEGEKNTRQSIRFVMDAIWRSRDMKRATELVQKYLEPLEEHDLMVRNARSLFERRQPEDVARIEALLAAGYRFRRQLLGQRDWLWLAQVVNSEEHKLWAISHLIPNENFVNVGDLIPGVIEVLAPLLNNEDEAVPEEFSIKAAAILFRIVGAGAVSPEVQAEMEETIQFEENLQILFPIAVAYLRDYVTTPEQRANPKSVWNMAFQVVHKEAKNRELDKVWRGEAAKILRQYKSECENLLTGA